MGRGGARSRSGGGGAQGYVEGGEVGGGLSR
jgi:hypothetical protein